MVLITLPLLYSTGCTENKAAEKSSAVDAVPVKTAPVLTTSHITTLEYAGSIASSSQAALSFKIGGIIAAVYVEEGDHVNKGQLLATLDLTEIDAQVRQAAQTVEKSSRDAQRVKHLYEDTAATLEQYQNVQTQLNVAQENLRIASFNRQYAQIRAAESGTIIKKRMNAGEMAAPGAPVLLMNGNSGNDWEVRFGVSDREWALLQKGTEAEVQVDAYPETTFRGIVSSIAEAADPATGTYEVIVKVLPNDKKFASGLFATVRIATAAPQQVTMIPIEAIAEADGKTGYVYTLNADRQTVSKHKVVIAFITTNKVAIRSGLEGITEVITAGVSYLTEQTMVKPAAM